MHTPITKVRLRSSIPSLQVLTIIALYGAKYLETLCEKNFIRLTPSQTLNQMYAAGLLHPTRERSRKSALPTVHEAKKIADQIHAGTDHVVKDVMLLKRWNGKLLAEKFNLPGMELEIERAVEQVEKSIADELAASQGNKDRATLPAKPSTERKND